jgi:hypothetical protein
MLLNNPRIRLLATSHETWVVMAYEAGLQIRKFTLLYIHLIWPEQLHIISQNEKRL